MALMAIIGELGSGKTLSLTYLLWRNWYYKRKIIYANYTLYGIPYYKIRTVSDLDRIRNGYVGADEMWIWIQTAGGERIKKKIIIDILRRSRKRKLTYAYTSQTLDQINPIIRKINDFVAYPILNPNNTVCKLMIFAGPKGKTLLKTHYFYTAPIFRMYDTNEEVEDLIDDVSEGSRSGVKPLSPKLKPLVETKEEEIERPRPIELNIDNREQLSLDDVEDVGTEEVEEYIQSSEELAELEKRDERMLKEIEEIIADKERKRNQESVETNQTSK